MKSARIILVLFTSFFVQLIFSQQFSTDFNVQLNVFQPTETKQGDLLDACFYDNHYYVLRRKPIAGPGGHVYTIDKLNDKLEMVENVDVSDRIVQDARPDVKLERIEESVVLTTCEYHTGKKTEVFALCRLNLDDMTCGKRMEIVRLEEMKRKVQRGVSFIQDQDKNFGAVFVHRRDLNGDIEDCSFTVLDSELNTIWSGNSLSTSYFPVVKVQYDASITATSRTKISKESDEFAVKVIRLDEEGGSTILINCEGFIPSGANVLLDEDGKFHVAGYTRNKNTGGIDGTFYMLADAVTGEVFKTSREKIPLDMIKSGESDDRKKEITKNLSKGKGNGLGNLRVRDIIVKEGNSLAIVGEVFTTYKVTQRSESGMITVTGIGYTKGNLYLSSVKDGELMDVQKVNKYRSEDDIYRSYRLILDNESLYIVFGDHIENHFTIDPKYGFKGSNVRKNGASVTVCKYDGRRVERSCLINLTEKKYKGFDIGMGSFRMVNLVNGEFIYLTRIKKTAAYISAQLN